jgi:hypothetical protein
VGHFEQGHSRSAFVQTLDWEKPRPWPKLDHWSLSGCVCISYVDSECEEIFGPVIALGGIYLPKRVQFMGKSLRRCMS